MKTMENKPCVTRTKYREYFDPIPAGTPVIVRYSDFWSLEEISRLKKGRVIDNRIDHVGDRHGWSHDVLIEFENAERRWVPFRRVQYDIDCVTSHLRQLLDRMKKEHQSQVQNLESQIEALGQHQ